MRIAIVLGFFLPVPPVRGGSTEKLWWRLAREFADAGHEVTLVTRAWENWPQRETDRGVTLLRVRGHDHSRWLPLNLLHDLVWSWRVRRSLPDGDLVVSNNVTLPFLLGRYPRRVGRLAVVLGRMPKGQTRAYGAVDRIYATSDAVAARVRATSPGLADRLAPFHYPIDWRLHQASRARRAADPTLTIAFVGRVHPEKGLDLLLAAAELLLGRTDLPPWRCRIIGPADIPSGGGGEGYRDSLLRRHGPNLGARLEFVGPVFDPNELARHYAATDVFCYPSVAESGETFGIAIAEAMAAGAVPVVSKLDCFADLVRSDATGLVFDHRLPRAAEELAGRLATLLADPGRRAALASAAQEGAAKHDYAQVAAELLADFAQLTGLPARPSSRP